MYHFQSAKDLPVELHRKKTYVARLIDIMEYNMEYQHAGTYQSWCSRVSLSGNVTLVD